MAHTGMAWVRYERGELDSALRHASDGVGLCRQLAYPLPLLAGLAILAWIRHVLGDRAGALAALEEAERVELSPAVVGLFNPVPTLRARLALAHGQVAEVARWLQDRGLSVDDAPTYPREGEYLVLVRVLLAQPAPDRALGLLERLHGLAVAQGRVGSLIELQALQALARQAAGDEPGALAALAEALTLAAPEGWLRVSVDEGPPMAALVGRFAAARRPGRDAGVQGVPPAYLARLVDAFARDGAPVDRRRGRGALPPGLVVPLTARELEVLRLLATGRPNPEIAEELVVTLDTVKRHVTHILDKRRQRRRTTRTAESTLGGGRKACRGSGRPARRLQRRPPAPARRPCV
jgi:ATP/maltotriose-dependent transcriptional regulator MalT